MNGSSLVERCIVYQCERSAGMMMGIVGCFDPFGRVALNVANGFVR
jgi:hypothetical protein